MNRLHLIVATGVAVLVGTVFGQSSILSPATPPPAPRVGWVVVDENRRSDDFYIAGQPDLAGLEAFAKLGGTLVINLRRSVEMDRIPFDEDEQAEKVGLDYLAIPVSPGSFSAEDIWAFDRAVREADGPVLVHCASGNRAAAMVAAHQTLVGHVPLGNAMHEAYGLGMRPSMAEPVRRVVLQDPKRIADRVNANRLRDDVFTLVSFGTRHTLSDTKSTTRGIGAARGWIKQRFEQAGTDSGRTGGRAVRVEFDAHTVKADGRRIPDDLEVVNVVCTIPGSMPEARDRLYYVVGHYDSRASDAMDAQSDAPGANDDGSGTVACLELARVLAMENLDATVVLLATAGEEQGLYGARTHARMLAEQGAQVAGVLSNDIIGDPSGPGGLMARDEIRVFSEGIPASVFEDGEDALRKLRTIRGYAAESDSTSRQLARYIAEVARTFATAVKPRLIFRPDRFLRGGDHTAFNEVGFPAVRFTDVHEVYTRQHQDGREEDGIAYGDVPEMVDTEYLADVTRLNAATIVNLANAPSPPPNVRIMVAQLTNDTTLRWNASPEPDVAGYQVLWRATTASDWQSLRDVGPALEATIDLSKDNWFFGIRAYDRDGYLSPVVTPVAARR
jgi:uncharacterized protein (TIGR01244 family)